MVALGTWLVLGPARIIRSITAIPTSLVKTPVHGSTSPGGKGLTIEIELRKMFPVPFFPARKLYVRANEIELPTELAPRELRLSVVEEKALARQRELARKAEIEYEETHVMSRGVRHMSRAFFNVYQSLGRAWTREGFLKPSVKGQVYKLDVTGGWALDGGKALDRLVVHDTKV